MSEPKLRRDVRAGEGSDRLDPVRRIDGDPTPPAREGAGAALRCVDPVRLRRSLGSPDLAWLVDRIRTRLFRGEPLDAPATLTDATPAQRTAAARLLGRRPGTGTSLSVRPGDVERILRTAGIAPDLRAAIEALTDRVPSRDTERARERAEREVALEAARVSRHATEPWYGVWLDEIERDGILTRLLHRNEGHRIAQAARVLDQLPGTPAGELAPAIPLPTLAERATGDTKALAATPLAGLVLRALALRTDVPRPASAEDRNALWESAGVIAGDLASQVLVLHLRVRPHPDATPSDSSPLLCDWLDRAAERSIPFRVTLHQLATMPVVPAVGEIFVCENPAVLRAAVCAVPPRAPGIHEVAPSAPEPSGEALLCTEGQPSLAADRLLRAATAAGVRVHWRNDFDWDGLRMTQRAIDRYAAEPWRMQASDYRTALEAGDSEALKGPPAPSPWNPDLATAMHQTGHAVMEERLTAVLLQDLRRSG